MDENITSLSSILLLIIKEVRLERGIHQAQLAEACGKTPSAWTKIETGRSPLTMEIMFRVCNRLLIPASAVLATTERYASLLAQQGWGIMSNQLEFDEDLLLKEASEYYGSAGFRNRMPGVIFDSVLNGPNFNLDGTVSLAPVFRFALDINFKNSQIDYNSSLLKLNTPKW